VLRRPTRGEQASLLAAVVFLAVSRPTFGVVASGAVLGSLVGLVALGIVLVYRSTRVLNIAQAGLGAVPATVALLLMTRGRPYLLAVPLALLLAVVLGLLVDLLLRRFKDGPRLIVTVATLGLAQVLAAAEVLLPKALTGKGLPPTSIKTPFTSFKVDTGGLRLTGDHVVALLVVIAVVVALTAFLRRSLIGTALRAAVDNRDRTATLGIPVDRLTAVVWVLAAMLSCLAVVLRTPLVGLPSGGGSSTTLLLYALAAAVIGRLESLPLTFAAAVAIGVLDSSAYFASRTPEPSIALILPLVLGALLLRRRSTSRSREESFRAVKELPAIPAALRGLPEVRAARAMGPVLVLLALVILPFRVPDARLDALATLPIFALAAVSVVVLTGWTGQISLGQWAFAGIGAIVTGRLSADAGWDAIVVLFLSAAAGALIAVLVGLPALRVDGISLAVVTLAVAGTTSAYLLNARELPWLQPHHELQRPILYQRYDTTDPTTFYFFCLAVLVLVLLAAAGFRRSRTGRLLLATRDNPRAAAAYGVGVSGIRLAGFAFAGAVAGLAGSLNVFYSTALDQPSYPVQLSITIFAIAVIGGITSLPGALAGAIYFVTFNTLLHDYAVLATGAGLLLLLLVAPGGLAEVGIRLRDRALHLVARRRGLVLDVFGALPEPVLEPVPA
jgi:branched-chain amino acid transport system permease protein